MNKEKLVQIGALLLRISASLIYLENGGMKLFGWFSKMPGGHLPTLMLVAGIIEFVGGLAIMFGLFTRVFAFLCSGEMAFAYFMAHAPHGHILAPLANQGEPAALLCFIFLFFAAFGGGVYSLDALIFKKKPATN